MTIGAHDTLRQKVGDTRVGRAPIRDTDHVGDLFARLLERQVRTISPVRVQVSLISGTVERLKTALPESEDPQLIAVGQCESSPFAAVAVMKAPLVACLVDAVSGSNTVSANQPTPRNFTSIDEALSEGFAKVVMESFEQALAPPPRAQGEHLVFSGFVRSLSAILDAPSDTDVLRYRLSLTFGRSETPLELSFLIPLNVLETLQPGDDTANRVLRATAADKNWQAAMVRAAATSKLPLTCVLAQIELSVREIGLLSKGSIIPLPVDQTMEVELRVDHPGRPDDQATIATGRLGAASGKRAIRLTRPPDPNMVRLLAPVADTTHG